MAARGHLLGVPSNPGRALLELNEALEINGTNAVTWMREAEIARGVGDLKMAGYLSSLAARLEPNFVGARLLSSEALLAAGKRRLASEEFQKAVDILKKYSVLEHHSAYERALLFVDKDRFSRLRLKLEKRR